MPVRKDLVEVEYGIPWSSQLSPASDVWVHTVAEILPPGFARYVRVFHPFVPWGAESGETRIDVRMRWAVLAANAGVEFRPTLTYRQLSPVLPLDPDGGGRPWAVWDGALDDATARALLAGLDDGRSEHYYFSYALGAYVSGLEPMMFRVDSLAVMLDAVGELRRGRGLPNQTPEYVWPADQRWIVCSDFDLTSTYVAADDDAAVRVLEDPGLEALEVDLDTRVDNCADEQG